jgi:UDP-N-acetylglucosamine 4,6-dehydratase
MIENKRILVFGGSGSLGHQFIETYIAKNTIVNYSRDECKHWQMNLKYKTDHLSFIIGDIRDFNRVETSILRVQPQIIIIMSALKHIDMCEYAIEECIKTNLNGPLNVLNTIEKNIDRLATLETVVFISTDKACEPNNAYGMTKALAESAMVEKSRFIQKCKFVNVRYGNVLNSRGSIIPILHKMGQDANIKEFCLTHTEMTRFVITLEESVALIEHAILYGESGDIVLSELVAMKMSDLMEIFSEKYNKPVKMIGLRHGEKMSEALVSETQAMRLVKTPNGGYMYIKPSYKNPVALNGMCNYNSASNPLTKSELEDYLEKNRYDM